MATLKITRAQLFPDTHLLIEAFNRRFPKEVTGAGVPPMEALLRVKCTTRDCMKPRGDFSHWCDEHRAECAPAVANKRPVQLCEHKLDARYLGNYLKQHTRWVCPECAKEAGYTVACCVCLAPAMINIDGYSEDPLPDLQELRTYFCRVHVVDRFWPFPNVRVYVSPQMVECNDCGDFHDKGQQCTPPSQKSAHREAKRSRSCPARDERCVRSGDCIH